MRMRRSHLGHFRHICCVKYERIVVLHGDYIVTFKTDAVKCQHLRESSFQNIPHLAVYQEVGLLPACARALLEWLSRAKGQIVTQLMR